jgi:hypothetical protein
LIGPPYSPKVELDPVVAALNIKAEVSEWLKRGASGRHSVGLEPGKRFDGMQNRPWSALDPDFVVNPD